MMRSRMPPRRAPPRRRRPRLARASPQPPLDSTVPSRSNGGRNRPNGPLAPDQASVSEEAGTVEKVAEVSEHHAQADESFRLLVESVRDYAIFMLDPTGHVVTWNLGAERIKGYMAEEIIGRHFSTFYLPEDAATGICEAELRDAQRYGRVEAEGWRLRKDGTRFWAAVVITALLDENGTLRGFAKVTRDTTERRQVTAALLEHERMLA